MLKQPRYLPDSERLSVLAATILLAYALTHFLSLPAREITLQLPGFFLSFTLDLRTAVAFLAAGLTASGADWLLHDHPMLKGKTYQHWILPALTALVIGFPLFQLPLGLGWWMLFLAGGLTLMMVLLAEYIVVDPDDVRYSLASAFLTAISFSLFLVLAIVLRKANARLTFELPAIAIAVFGLSARSLNLRTHGRWLWWESLAVAFITLQIAAAFHYWPATPVAFGLAVLGPAYALTSLFSRLAEGEPARQAVIEPLIILAAAWGGALWAG